MCRSKVVTAVPCSPQYKEGAVLARWSASAICIARHTPIAQPGSSSKAASYGLRSAKAHSVNGKSGIPLRGRVHGPTQTNPQYLTGMPASSPKGMQIGINVT